MRQSHIAEMVELHYQAQQRQNPEIHFLTICSVGFNVCIYRGLPYSGFVVCQLTRQRLFHFRGHLWVEYDVSWTGAQNAPICGLFECL